MEVNSDENRKVEILSPVRISRKSILSNGRNSVKRRKIEEKEKQKKKIPEEYIIEILKKEKNQRTKLEIKHVTNLLGEKIEYFKKLKDDNQLAKSEKIVSLLNLEKYNPNQYIMKFGEEGDKFYIVLTGKVALYKPTYNRKEMTLQQYSDLMYDIRYHELDTLKYDRMLEKNSHLKIDVEILFKLDSNAQSLKQISYFFIEEDQQLGIFGEGFPFGEIALIKNCKRNASVKAIDETYCISLTKSDYNRIIRELEQKRLEKSLNNFKRDYPLFQSWNSGLMLKLFNGFAKINLSKGDYLYKQNEDSNYIYVINKGTFEAYSMLSFGWIQTFYSYIINANGNIIKKCIDNGKMKETDLKHLYDDLLQNAEISPCVFDPYKNRKIITSHSRTISLAEIKNEEEKLLNSNKLFKALIRVVNYKDVIGIEDALECKKRLYYVKCISEKGEAQKISVFDFIKILNLTDDKKLKTNLLDFIAKKKKYLYKQIYNSIKSASIRVENNINYNYDKYLSENEEKNGSETENRKEIPQKIKRHFNHLKSNSLSEFYNEKTNKTKAFITNKDSLPSLKFLNFNSKKEKDLILSEKNFKNFTRNHHINSKPTSSFNQYHNLSKNVHFENKSVYSNINFNENMTNITVTIPINKPLNRNDLNTLIINKKNNIKSIFKASPIDSIKIVKPFERNINFSDVYQHDVLPKKLRFIGNKSTGKKSIRLNNIIANSLISNISEDKINKTKSERYINFKGTINSKKFYLDKNFKSLYDDEANKDSKKHNFSSSLFSNLNIMLNTKI